MLTILPAMKLHPKLNFNGPYSLLFMISILTIFSYSLFRLHLKMKGVSRGSNSCVGVGKCVCYSYRQVKGKLHLFSNTIRSFVNHRSPISEGSR